MTYVKNYLNQRLKMGWLRANATGKGVEVAVIDSGVDATHPDLAGRVSRACRVFEKDGKAVCEEVDPAGLPDSYGHGTAVAGIISSIAPDARIINVKVLNEYNACSADILLEGLRWTLGQNVSLINMSLALSNERFFPGMFRLCERAYEKSSIVVASRRNFGDMGCPSMFSTVISVDRGDFENPDALKFSKGSLIEYDAHGTRIRVPVPGGGYEEQSGTSFATPRVTGFVALLLERFPRLLSFEVKTILKAMAGWTPKD
ncbi:MAG: S8 family serine peptidase [Proteobacteria bacterium]|nr:S8 family serine peptidase [Pseudomonadota bacterium]